MTPLSRKFDLFSLSPGGDIVIIRLTILRRPLHRPPNGAYAGDHHTLIGYRTVPMNIFKHPQPSFFSL